MATQTLPVRTAWTNPQEEEGSERRRSTPYGPTHAPFDDEEDEPEKPTYPESPGNVQRLSEIRRPAPIDNDREYQEGGGPGGRGEPGPGRGGEPGRGGDPGGGGDPRGG